MIELWDLPIGKGLQERIHEFRRMDEQVQLRPILDRLAERPPLDLASSEGLEDELPQIAGGIAVALARIFTIVDPKVNPASEGWDRAVRIFRLLL